MSMEPETSSTRIRDLRLDVEAHKDVIATLRAQLAEREAVNGDLANDIKLQRLLIDAMKGDVADLTAQLADAQAARDQHRDDAAELRTRVGELTEAMKKWAKWRTKDGVYVEAGDWVVVDRNVFRFKVSDEATIPCAIQDGAGWRDMCVTECYSSRRAAQAAESAKGETC